MRRTRLSTTLSLTGTVSGVPCAAADRIVKQVCREINLPFWSPLDPQAIVKGRGVVKPTLLPDLLSSLRHVAQKATYCSLVA